LSPYLPNIRLWRDCKKIWHDGQWPNIRTECRFRDYGRWDTFILDTGERVEIVNGKEDARKPYDERAIVIGL